MSTLDLFGTTRGKVMARLREGPATVNELAEALGLTDNAIRAQLAEMQGDGLAEVAGERMGTRKPHTLYALTPRAHELLSRLYVPVLNTLLELLRERLTGPQLDGLLREAGERLAEPHRAAMLAKAPAARLAAAVHLLESLGGRAEAVRTGEGTVIQGRACPLGAAVTDHPQVCGVVEAFLSEVLGTPVKERCQKTPTARCCFSVEGVR